MNEKIFAIIGKPLSHSLSPIMHSYWYKKYNINAKYMPIEIEQNKIKEVIEKLKKKQISGINITLPYKSYRVPIGICHFLGETQDFLEENLSFL